MIDSEIESSPIRIYFFFVFWSRLNFLSILFLFFSLYNKTDAWNSLQKIKREPGQIR